MKLQGRIKCHLSCHCKSRRQLPSSSKHSPCHLRRNKNLLNSKNQGQEGLLYNLPEKSDGDKELGNGAIYYYDLKTDPIAPLILAFLLL